MEEAETNNPNKGATLPLRGAAKRSHELKLELDALLECTEDCGNCLRGIGHGLVYCGAGLLLVGFGAGRLALTGVKAVTRGCINVFEWSYRKLQKREGK